MKAEIRIERVGQEGQGVGYDSQGNVYFVQGAIPGDVVEVSFPDDSRRYRDAELVQVKIPSPQRVTPVCRHFSDCGGCDWLHWDYTAQLAAKSETLQHVLNRGTLTPEKFLPICGADKPLGYRGRIQVHQIGSRVGFHRRRTHEIVEVEYCHLAHPKLNEALLRLRSEGGEPHRKRRIELSIGEDGAVWSNEWFRGAKTCFSQVNADQNIRLRQMVSDWVRDCQANRVLELFCGNGNLTFTFGQWTSVVVGVDNSDDAIDFARGQVEKEGASGRITFICADVSQQLRRKLPTEFQGGYDTLVLDPPRSGIECGLEIFVHDGLRHIIYVSCSPLSFSKDVQCLKKNFSFKQVQAIDMFPHSRHIEFVSLFSRA